MKLTHLAFADDLMFFCRGDPSSVKILMETLTDFGCKSGLLVNVMKSSLFSAGIHGQELQAIQQLVNFPQGVLPVRYLGTPLAAVKFRVAHYGLFMEKIVGYLNSWSSASLSYAGRVELIRSVLQGVDCFWLSILPIPATVIDRISGLCRFFLWHSNHPLVAWKEVCLPKDEGGLGFKDLKHWNTALLAKVLWNLHMKKDTLWVRRVHHQYFKTASVWDYVAKRNDSPLIKKLLGIRDGLVHAQDSLSGAANLLSS